VLKINELRKIDFCVGIHFQLTRPKSSQTRAIATFPAFYVWFIITNTKQRKTLKINELAI
jgi:hypothetical protein